MLRPVPSARLLRALKASIDERQTICSFCRVKKAKNIAKSTYSTVAPATTINAQATIPEEHRELYDKLIAFGKASSIYVNLSQLRLALKDLESKKSTTRIAVLGVNSAHASRQLVRSLLADPLSPPAQWEQELQRLPDDGKPLVIRTGVKTSLDSSNPVVRTLTIQSPLLEQHQVELLISRIDFQDNWANKLTEAGLSTLLSPSLHPQQSLSGRSASITYPVHKAILLENGFQSVLGLANVLQSAEGKTAAKMVKIVSNVNWSKLPISQHGVMFVDLEKAQHAVKAFRDSLNNATTYEHEWLECGMPALTSIVMPATSNDAVVNTTTIDLINHILDETVLAIDDTETESAKTRTNRTVPEAVRQKLQDLISTWAEQAHTEFQEEITNILYSKQWRKLVWWKLLWRIDEIEMLASDAVRRTYLIEAEKNAMYLGGRIAEAGLIDKSTLPIVEAAPEPDPDTETAINKDVWSHYNRQPWNTFNHRPPFLSIIGVSRTMMLQIGIPPFAAVGQRYLLSAASVTALTSLTSILAYISSSSTTFYEAGTIAAVGFIASAWRLQTRWERARTAWISYLWREGKRGLDGMEQGLRKAVREGGRSVEPSAELEDRVKARAAIDEVRQTLSKLEDVPPSTTGSL